MQIRIIAVGKIKENFLQEGIREYEKRLRPYVKLQIVELAEEKRPATCSGSQEKQVRHKEGERILAAIPAGSFVVTLDVKGVSWSSEVLAESIRQWEISGKNTITILIGGDLGLSDEVRSRSNLQLSLSSMTFTHQMVRLILLEQIYRAYRIKCGEPYHK
jgi:23S rRNA (pseudouridine1915-N3)-methyltransferase